MEEKYFFAGKQIALEEVGEKTRRKIVAHGGTMMTVEVHFEKGAVGAVHTHVHEQSTYCVKGKAIFTLGDVEYTLEAGDSLYMPSNVAHGCVAVEDTVLLDIFTPQREDFKKS